jgi:MoaA/NifB/PqqE/SkfB family radical SAM enzyme
MRHALNMLRVLADRRIVGPPFRLARRLKRRWIGERTVGKNEGLKDGLRERLAAWEFVRRWLRREGLRRHNGQWVVNSFIPPFPGPAFDRMFAPQYFQRPYVVGSASLAVTGECPADCWHCSMKKRRGGRPLATAEWLDAIDRLLSLGTYNIGITGGEPLLREDLPELVRAASHGGAIVQLFTSGIGLTEAKIDALREAGLWAVGVSLDHTDPATVKRLRGTPWAFDAAIAALELSRSKGLYTLINAVADREMVDAGEHCRLYDLASRLKLHELRLIEPMPCGRLDSLPADRLLDAEQISRLRQFHRETNRRGRGPKVCAFNEMESPELFGCCAGTGHLHIDPCGEVCPCNFVPLSFGNLREERLEAVYDRMSIAMRQPRRHCFIQSNAPLIQLHAAGREYPLRPEISMQVAAQSPRESLPDYFRLVGATLRCIENE